MNDIKSKYIQVYLLDSKTEEPQASAVSLG